MKESDGKLVNKNMESHEPTERQKTTKRDGDSNSPVPIEGPDFELQLREWLRFVEQDCTAQAVQYLDECNTQTWGE